MVTGSTGFIGRQLCAQLAARGWRVDALVRTAQTAPPVVARELLWSHRDAPGQLPRALQGVDAVIHCAGLAHLLGADARQAQQRFHDVNVSLSERLALQAARAGVRRLVFLSSIKVNGESTDGRGPFLASDPPAPSDAYARSKAEAEQRLHEIGAEQGLEIVIIRPPLVYGPGVSANLLRLLAWVSKGVPLPLGAVCNQRSMIGLDNLCDLITRAVEHPAAAGEVFLAADDEDLSTPALVRLMAAGLGRPARLMPIPTGVVRVAAAVVGRRAEADRLLGSLRVDASQARSLLGWRPPVTTAAGIFEMASWYSTDRLAAVARC
ncbi:hypothetical protein CCR96_01100 [Halochromatium roseum]|nr:hypothetical protein [Halochromatium roseum]